MTETSAPGVTIRRRQQGQTVVFMQQTVAMFQPVVLSLVRRVQKLILKIMFLALKALAERGLVRETRSSTANIPASSRIYFVTRP